MQKTLFEQMGGTYRQVGDYLLPNFEELHEERPIGIWGRRHQEHLRRTNKMLFEQLFFSGKLDDYLADIDRQAEEMLSQLAKQLTECDGITEELKATNQMEWVQRMNAVRAQAEEIVYHDLIYC